MDKEEKSCRTCKHLNTGDGSFCTSTTPCNSASLIGWEPKLESCETVSKHITGSYELLGQSIGALVDEKKLAYGDSFGKSGSVLKILFPDGIKVEQYDDVLCITRILDKLFRIANDKDAFGESPYRDIVGYGLLGIGKENKGGKHNYES